jgi:hypothetical protein
MQHINPGLLTEPVHRGKRRKISPDAACTNEACDMECMLATAT